MRRRRTGRVDSGSWHCERQNERRAWGVVCAILWVATWVMMMSLAFSVLNGWFGWVR